MDLGRRIVGNLLQHRQESCKRQVGSFLASNSSKDPSGSTLTGERATHLVYVGTYLDMATEVWVSEVGTYSTYMLIRG